MARLIMLLLAALSFAVMPLSAQDAAPSPLDWIPADFSGLVRLDLSNAGDTIQRLNISKYIASFLQPARIAFDRRQTFSDFFPLDILDTENASFEGTILPWVQDEMIVAYRAFDDTLTVSDDDLLVILPTGDPFGAAAFLSRIVESQDFPQHETYRGASLYIGDRTGIAFTPGAVLIGAQPVLHAAIDAHDGVAARLVDLPAFAAVSAADLTTQNHVLFVYLSGSEAARALSVALQGSVTAEPLLHALGDALNAYDIAPLEAALLTGDIDSIGIQVQVDTLRNTLTAAATVQTRAASEAPDGEPLPPEQTILAFIPRSAMVVQSGGDARSMFYDALVTLPMSSYIQHVLGGFINTAPPPDPVYPPTSDDLQAAVNGFTSALDLVHDFSMDDELVAHLGDSYAVAVIPRPNNPALLTGAPYDLLLAVDVENADEALEGALQLIQVVLAVSDDVFEQAEVEGVTFETIFIEPGHEPLVQLGVTDNTLIVSTGSAAELALRAHSGDNQLIDTERWQSISPARTPALYLDLNALYNTFIPTTGGPVSQDIGQLGANAQSLGGGLYQLEVIVTIPQ